MRRTRRGATPTPLPGRAGRQTSGSPPPSRARLRPGRRATTRSKRQTRASRGFSPYPPQVARSARPARMPAEINNVATVMPTIGKTRFVMRPCARRRARCCADAVRCVPTHTTASASPASLPGLRSAPESAQGQLSAQSSGSAAARRSVLRWASAQQPLSAAPAAAGW